MSPPAEYLACRGISGERELSLLFLLGWRTLGLPGGADSVKPCPTTGGHPKGLGESAESGRLSPCQQSKNGLLKGLERICSNHK